MPVSVALITALSPSALPSAPNSWPPTAPSWLSRMHELMREEGTDGAGDVVAGLGGRGAPVDGADGGIEREPRERPLVHDLGEHAGGDAAGSGVEQFRGEAGETQPAAEFGGEERGNRAEAGIGDVQPGDAGESCRR